MHFTLRPSRVPDDFPAIAAIATAINPEPMTVAHLERDEANANPESIRYRLVAEDETGRVLGYGFAVRDPYDQPGYWFLRANVDPNCRRQGVGRALYEAVEGFALERGATRLIGSVREYHPEAVEFARRRVYQIERHMFESTLDLAAFDPAPFAGVVDGVRAGGIRFFSLADAPGEGTERALYELVKKNCPDIPGYDLAEFVPYDEWRRWEIENPEIPADCWTIAADGDRLVGATFLIWNPEKRSMYTGHTSVDRDYRGRQIALALKLLSIENARRYEAVYMRTNNDSQNQPMLAVNRKLGYKPAPGFYRMVREVR